MKKILVHGYMIYKCEKCKKEFRMWCEKGIEEGDKPSPFVIHHTCGGLAKDISGLFRINKPRPNPMLDYDAGYMFLPNGESYLLIKKVLIVECLFLIWSVMKNETNRSSKLY